MADKQSAVATLKAKSDEGNLPPWGDRLPARPLSPKRRPKVESKVVKPRWSANNVPAYKFLCAISAAAFSSYLLRKPSLNDTGSLEEKAEAKLEGDVLTVASGAYYHEDKDAVGLNQLQNKLSGIEELGHDVFILADAPDPEQLENRSVGSCSQGVDEFVPLYPSGSHSERFTYSRVLMGTLRLEEVGTAWSLPQLPVAQVPEPSSISFRLPAEGRSPTYKLHWLDNSSAVRMRPQLNVEAGSKSSHIGFVTPTHERPPTYKLQWFDDETLAGAEELQLNRGVAQPRPYELRWRV